MCRIKTQGPGIQNTKYKGKNEKKKHKLLQEYKIRNTKKQGNMHLLVDNIQLIKFELMEK